MEIKDIRNELKGHINYILRHIELLKPNYLIDKIDWNAKGFNSHHFKYVVCKEYKGQKFKELPEPYETHLIKLMQYVLSTLEMWEEFINRIDDERQKRQI